MSTQTHRLERPAGYDRTDPDDRESYPGNISLTHREAFESITEELEHWGKTDVQIETASEHYANDPNIPHKSGDPDDVGVVAYYRDLEGHSSEQSAIACDSWETQRENARDFGRCGGVAACCLRRRTRSSSSTARGTARCRLRGARSG